MISRRMMCESPIRWSLKAPYLVPVLFFDGRVCFFLLISALSALFQHVGSYLPSDSRASLDKVSCSALR